MIDLKSMDWTEILTGEMLLLGMLGRIFYTYPNGEEQAWLLSLVDENVFSEAPFATDVDETQAGLKLLQAWGEKIRTDGAFEHLQADYTHLFIGPGKVVAAPWESVYLNEDRVMFQQQTLDVRIWFSRFGLEAEKKYSEPDDHMGLELLFLSHLASLGIEALEKQDFSRVEAILKAQAEFFENHPGKWGLTWCGLVGKNAQTDFYKGLALLTRGALIKVADVLDVKIAKDAAQ